MNWNLVKKGGGEGEWVFKKGIRDVIPVFSNFLSRVNENKGDIRWISKKEEKTHSLYGFLFSDEAETRVRKVSRRESSAATVMFIRHFWIINSKTYTRRNPVISLVFIFVEGTCRLANSKDLKKRFFASSGRDLVPKLFLNMMFPIGKRNCEHDFFQLD